MSNRKAAILLVCQLLLTSWTLVGVVSASSTPPTTTIAITTSFEGVVSDGNSVYVSANPEFTLTHTLSNNNSSFINSEYEIVEGSQSSGISNYSAAVTVWANHSTNMTLKYRSNSTTGLEAWKSLNLIVDADLPTLTINSNNSSALRYKQNQSVYVTSNLTPLTFSCVDTISGVANLSASIGSQQFNSNSSSLSLNNLPNSISGNNTFTIVVICKDNVNNEINRTYTVILDDSIPTLSYSEMGVRSQKLTSDCISADWGINVQSSDFHSNSHVERWDVNSWNQVSNSIGVSSNFSGDIILRASDAVGLSSSNQSWNVTVDSTLPIIQHNINSSSLSINSSDNCGIASMQYRWETFDGQNLGWTNSQNASISVPSVLNGSIIRAQIKATDVIGNTNYSTTSWVNTNGSLPYSTISVLSNRYGNTINDNASFSLTPVGYQSNASWELFVNNVSDSSGNTSSQITINKEFSHQDSIRIEINTTDGLSNYSVYNWTYVVDSSNSHQILISVSGDFLGATNLTLGPTGRLVPGLPSDDSSGVGGSHASCSWNEVDWFQVQANSSYFPSTNPGTTETFEFACRSVDLLGNEGPITWRNGSVDLESPTISLQPGSSSTIGPNSTITVNVSDSSGVSSSDISMVWKNSSSKAYSNTSLGSSNISSSIYHLFPGLVDGTINATLTVEDNVGNTQYVSKVWTLNTSKPFITVSLSGEYNGQFVTNDSTGFTLSLPSGGWVGLSTNYTLTDSNGSVVDTGDINSTKTLSPTGLLEGNLTLDVLTTDSLGKSQSQNWTYYVDSSNSHQVMVSVNGDYTGTVSPILGPTGRLVPGLPSDESSGVGGSHVNCSWNGINWFQVNTNSSFAPTTNPGSTQSFVFACRSVDLFGNQGPITWNNGSVDLQSPNVSMQPRSSSTIGPNSTIVNNFTDDTGIHSSTLSVVWTNGSSTNSSVTSHGNSNFTATLSQLLNSLGDGTITATLTVEDTVGNTQSVTRVWNLNTSKPFITVSLSGKYQTQFVTNDSTGFTLTLPSGGWVGLTTNYTLTDSSGSVVSTGDINSTTTLNPTGLLEGNLTLEVLTTDSLGKAQSQNWTYYVDSSNGQSPVISIDGLNLTSSNVTWMGVGSTFKISSISDDSNGVGANRASCSWDESNWFDVGSSNSVTPSTFSGQHENHTLTCKNVDFLGNEGPTTQYNASTDRILPLQSISPSSSSHISPGSSISVDLSDQSGIQSSIFNISWSNGTSSWSTSVQIYSLNWNSSINSIKSGLTDGFISVDLYTIDNLGNENKTTGHFWYLNTSEPISSVNLVGQNYGSYVQGGEDFAIGLTPPTIANSNGWAIYTLEHSNGTQLGTGNISSYTEIGYGQNTSLTSGTIWLNITSYDIFMRSKIQNWTFIVDNSVGTFPNYSIQGSAINKSGNPILGPSGYIGIASLQDDVGGVGYSHANCTWDNSTWFNSNLTSVMIPSSTSGSNVSFNLGCSIVDLLGNQGAFKWINGEVDSIKPAISYSITSGSLLSSNSSFNISCTDKNGCSLSQVTIFYNNGSNSLWKSTTISGSTSGVTISSLLNATSSGTITFYSIASDQLGNSRNQSSVSLQYLHDLPTIITTINSENSGSYIDNNLTFTVIPSSGWMTGINVSMTVKHSNSTTFSYNGSVNQSTSQQTYNNLSEGDIWINTTICDLLSRCSNSTVHLYVDNTAPSAPSFSISGGYQYQNQSYLLQGSSIFVMQRGSDTASKTLNTVCNSSNSVISFTTSQNSISVQSMIGSEEWSTIYCKSTDKVGNVGNSGQITIRRDDTSPTVSISDQSISGIIVPSKWYNSTCNDNVLVENQNLKVFSNSNLLYQTNSTGNISLRYGSISNLGANGLIDIELTCTDEAGNEKIDSRRLEWLPYLSPSTISASGVQQNSTIYVTNGTAFTISNSRSDVYHEYRYIINGSAGVWITENSTSFSLDIGDGNDSKNLRIQINVLKEGTSFSNTTYSNLMLIDLTGPTILRDSNSTLSNGSHIDLSSSYSGVEISHYVWSWDNSSTIQSNNLSDVILPASAELSSWLSIVGYDNLGNQGLRLNSSIARDTTPPQVTFNNSHHGYLGPSTKISIEITESTGISMSNIWINSTSGQSTLIVSNITSYQLSSTDYPAWIWNNTIVSVIVEVKSVSGIYTVSKIDVSADNTSPSASIVNSMSFNFYGLNSSNMSEIFISKSLDTSSICVKSGSNQTNASESNCLNGTNDKFQIIRGAGNYIILVNITDYAGNTNLVRFNLTHHVNPPSVNSAIASVIRPGDIQNYTVASALPYSTKLFWDNSTLQDQGGWFLTPIGTGNHTFTANVTNVVGLSIEESWDVILDGNSPNLTMEGQIISGNIGTNSTLFVNSTDEYSKITYVELIVSNGNISCNKTWNPQSTSFKTNSTLTSFLNSNCSLIQANIITIQVNITSIDSLGNTGFYTQSLIYHGGINPPLWQSNNSVQSSNFYWISNFSTISCVSSAGTYLPEFNLSWTGSGAVISENSVSSVTSSGVVTCDVSDAFGNSAMSSLNLTYDNTIPTVSLSMPSNSSIHNGTNYVLSGGPPFTISYQDNQTGIYSAVYCTSITSNCVNWQQISSNSIPLTQGNGTMNLFVNITNGVKVSKLHNISFIQDDAYPEIVIQDGHNTEVDNLVIYAGSASPDIIVTLNDDNCISNGSISHDFGSSMITTNSSPSIPLSITWLRIDTTDCVGHETSSNYTVIWVTNINAPSITIDQRYSQTGYLSNNNLVFNGGIILRSLSTHPIELGLNCTTSSPNVVISCNPIGSSNMFNVTINYSNSNTENVILHYTDNLGNSINWTLQVSTDDVGPICEVKSSALIIENSTNNQLFLSPNRDSEFVCVDDFSSVKNVRWENQVTSIGWIKINNTTWKAPPPPLGQVQLIATDSLENERSTYYNVSYDNYAPVYHISNQNRISFDEGRTKSDGTFDLTCQENLTILCNIEVTQILISSGETVSTADYYNTAQITIAGALSDVRLDIRFYDVIGNEATVSQVFTLDNDRPNLVVNSYDNYGMLIQNYGVASSNGKIIVQGVYSSDVNISQSSGVSIDCIQPPMTVDILALQSEYDLADYQLDNCTKLRFTLSAVDHVGNIQTESLIYAIDHVIPSVDFYPDSDCSWQSDEFTDMQSFCHIVVEVNDDASQDLISQYQLNIREEGSSDSEIYGISASHTLSNLGSYLGKNLLISVTGSDLAGNPVESNLLRVQVRDVIEPKWEGLVCLELGGCGFDGNVTAAHVNDMVNITTFYGQAPISSISAVFENALTTYSFSTTTIDYDSLPDGEYSLSIELEDEAGRYYNSGYINFVYDNQAPVIQLMTGQSIGLLDEDIILSCDECKLVWKVSDVTSTISETNHGNYPMTSGQYEMQTSTLGVNQIEIKAIDSFGRESVKELNTILVKSTQISTVEELIEEDDVRIMCIDEPTVDNIRQVVCLWSRIQTNIDNLPIKMEISVDQIQLRDVKIITEIGGETNPQTITQSNGVITIQDISKNVGEFTLTIEDSYSDIAPIKFRLFEHERPWSDIKFINSEIGEDDNSSDFKIIVKAPLNEQEFYLIESDYSAEELFSCSSEYVFKQGSGNIPFISPDNCQITDSDVNTDGDLILDIHVEHPEIDFVTHKLFRLFNLKSYSTILSYNDPLGVSYESNSWDLELDGSNQTIIRAPNSIPVFNSSGVDRCPLEEGVISKHNGFLQDDEFFAISECANHIEDFDGIKSIIWEFDFKLGNGESYPVEIKCVNKHFPKEWDLKSSIEDNEKCDALSQPFPDNTGYTVEIRVRLEDSSEFQGVDRDQKLRRLSDDCKDDFSKCEILVLKIEQVTVSSNLNPVNEIKNARSLEDFSESMISSSVFQTLMGVAGASIAYLVVIFMIKKKSDSYVSRRLKSLSGKLIDLYESMISKSKP